MIIFKVKAIMEGVAGKTALKKVVIKVAKKTISKALPLLGWGMFAYDFIDCMW